MIKRFGVLPPLRLDLSVKRYADDLTLLYPETKLTEDASHEALDLRAYTLLVVDDVLYTGHSLLKVVDYLARKGPAEIRVAVLADRGCASACESRRAWPKARYRTTGCHRVQCPAL
jgi:pyrimidine operon attenuation protein/uracil phosphoribosyltransferase